MIVKDKQEGVPLTQFRGLKTDIESMAGAQGGMLAFGWETDPDIDGEYGHYDQVTAAWVWESSTAGSNSFVFNEALSGTVNGVNTIFTTSVSFVAGSLALYLDGQLMKLGDDYTETDVDEVTFSVAPTAGSAIIGFYQHVISSSGNADTVDGYHASSFVLKSAIRFVYPFASYINISPLTTTNSYPFSTTLPTFSTFPKKYSQAVFIAAGSSDSSNYWTLELRDAGTNTVIASVNTQGLAANAGYTLADTTMAISELVQSTHKYLYIIATKTGTPSNLNVHAPSVEYGLE